MSHFWHWYTLFLGKCGSQHTEQCNFLEENKELRLQLGACQSAKGGKPDGGDQETAELEKLINYAKDLRKKYDEIRLLTSKKQGQLNIKLDKIKDLERDAVQPQGPWQPPYTQYPAVVPTCSCIIPPPLPAKTSCSFSGYEANAWLRPRLRSCGVLQDMSHAVGGGGTLWEPSRLCKPNPVNLTAWCCVVERRDAEGRMRKGKWTLTGSATRRCGPPTMGRLQCATSGC